MVSLKILKLEYSLGHEFHFKISLHGGEGVEKPHLPPFYLRTYNLDEAESLLIWKRLTPHNVMLEMKVVRNENVIA